MKGFPYKDQIEELFIVMFSFLLFPTHNIFNFLVYFAFLNLKIVFGVTM